MTLTIQNSPVTSRKDTVLSQFKAITAYKQLDSTGTMEFNDLQEKVTKTRTLFGKTTSREVTRSVSPEKAAADFMDASATIYVQRMMLFSTVLPVPCTLVPMGAPSKITNDKELEDAARTFSHAWQAAANKG